MDAWHVFAALVGLALVVDLRGRRADAGDGGRGALAWSAVWVGLALAFGGYVAWARGADAAASYVTAWAVEKSLSLDNVFVFSLVFSAFALTPRQRGRALLVGVLAALVLRAVMLGAGAALVARFHWLLPACGAVLLVMAVAMLRARTDGAGAAPPWLARWLERTGAAGSPRRRVLAAVALVVGADLVFAVDSVPAVLAISTDPFVVVTANVFALLGLRSLSELLETALARLRYVKVGVAVVLAFVGAKLLVAEHLPVDSLTSLAVIVLILGAAVFASLRARAAPQVGGPAPAAG